jgi:hypothetical protein
VNTKYFWQYQKVYLQNLNRSLDGNEAAELSKYQRFETTKCEDQTVNEFDLKLNKFFDLLNSEKENNFKFDTHLIQFKSTVSAENEIVASSSEFQAENGGLAKPRSDEESILDTFLRKLKEEKLKNEQFNTKLNQILD